MNESKAIILAAIITGMATLLATVIAKIEVKEKPRTVAILFMLILIVGIASGVILLPGSTSKNAEKEHEAGAKESASLENDEKHRSLETPSGTTEPSSSSDSANKPKVLGQKEDLVVVQFTPTPEPGTYNIHINKKTGLSRRVYQGLEAKVRSALLAQGVKVYAGSAEKTLHVEAEEESHARHGKLDSVIVTCRAILQKGNEVLSVQERRQNGVAETRDQALLAAIDKQVLDLITTTLIGE